MMMMVEAMRPSECKTPTVRMQYEAAPRPVQCQVTKDCLSGRTRAERRKKHRDSLQTPVPTSQSAIVHCPAREFGVAAPDPSLASISPTGITLGTRLEGHRLQGYCGRDGQWSGPRGRVRGERNGGISVERRGPYRLCVVRMVIRL